MTAHVPHGLYSAHTHSDRAGSNGVNNNNSNEAVRNTRRDRTAESDRERVEMMNTMRGKVIKRERRGEETENRGTETRRKHT